MTKKLPTLVIGFPRGTDKGLKHIVRTSRKLLEVKHGGRGMILGFFSIYFFLFKCVYESIPTPTIEGSR